MALITCPDCGKEFSDQVAACPNCGGPNKTKFCKFCGATIDQDCIVCPKCGKQVEQLNTFASGNIVINNIAFSSTSAPNALTMPVHSGSAKNKWVALLLCIFTVFGHKFYEGKISMGILYLFTVGLFGIGWIIDIIALLAKPNPYYV